MALKKKLNQPIKDNKIMSDERFKHLEDVLNRIEVYVKERLDKVETRMKDNEDDNDMLKDRIANIEKYNAITRREIAIYITITIFVILQVLEKINII